MLILFETSNDLDVDTLRSLEEALQDFHGAAIIVSHDRYFLDRTCNHILAFADDGSGRVEYFYGNFTQYEQEKRAALGSAYTPKRVTKFKSISAMT